jgi:glycosyltransferase involved in cell wall biosynthesis
LEAARATPERVVVATHYFASGPLLDLEAYLRDRTRSLVFIAHPLFEGQGPSVRRRYLEGQPGEVLEQPGPRGPARYVLEVWRTVRWAGNDRFDVFIAGDNLLALAGLWLRFRGRVRSVILYTIDFSPKRFRNRILNFTYHSIDRFAAGRVQAVWNVSPAIEVARRQRDGAARTAPQLVVPLGAHFDRIQRVPLSRASKTQVAFLGHLLEKQGVQLVIQALPSIRAAVPGTTLLVIGDGPYAASLRSLAASSGVSQAIDFAGYVEDHAEIERRLTSSALAVAPYVPNPDSFTNFADPGKIKTYLACGLPVVLTDVPEIAKSLAAKGAGRVVPYDAPALAEAVIAYLTDPASLERARQAATDLGAMYDWDRIFNDAFAQTRQYLR